MVNAKKNIIDIMRESEIVAMPYDVYTDSTLPVAVRVGMALDNYKRAVSVAKELGGV
jgi:hypothetical protein